MYKIPDDQADNWAPIIGTQGAKRRLKARRRNRGVEIYPGIRSDDRAFMDFNRALAIRLSEALPVNVDPSGVLDSVAIPGDFYQLLTVAGYGMNPISVPPMRNDLIRRDSKLLEQFESDRDKTIFADLVKWMFARSAPAAVSIRREASTGAPDYVNDVPKKKMELRAVLANWPRFLDLVQRGDLMTLFVEFNSPIVQTTGERTQADKVQVVNGTFQSKDREVNDEEAARSSLRSGNRFPADKRVIVNGIEVSDHFAGRRRTVFGMSFVPNYFLAMLCSSWRVVYLNDFAFTWKHRSPAEILEKMGRYKYLVGFDVKQFDQTVPTFLIDAMLNELELYVDQRVCGLIRLMFRAPYIVPYPWAINTDADEDHEFNPLYGDDPFDVSSFTMELGLPSGIAINPDTGKLMMVFQYLVLLDRYFKDVLEVGIDVILRGECDRYAMLNMGDDCVLLVNDDGFQSWVRANPGAARYFALEEETPISFLGNVPYRDDSGNLRLAPNCISYLVNWLSPEFGIDHMKRRNFWAIGERERRVHYAQAPSYQFVYNTFEEEFARIFGTYPSSLAANAYEQQRRYQNLSTWDALVLQNPDYLHYKVDESQISPEILDVIVTSIGPDETWPVVSRLTDRRFQQI